MKEQLRKTNQTSERTNMTHWRKNVRPLMSESNFFHGVDCSLLYCETIDVVVSFILAFFPNKIIESQFCQHLNVTNNVNFWVQNNATASKTLQPSSVFKKDA